MLTPSLAKAVSGGGHVAASSGPSEPRVRLLCERGVASV